MAFKPIAILTNVTQYAGPASLLALADLGATVYAHDPTFGDESVREDFEKASPGVIAVAGDRLRVAQQAVDQAGRIDVYIENSVAVGERHLTDDNDADALAEWLGGAAEEMVVEPCKLLNFVSRIMRDQKSGSVVLFGSESWFKPQHGSAYYSAMRAIAPSMALGAARDLGRHGIQVNSITPNYLVSDEYYPAKVWDTPEKKKELAQIVPLGRLNTNRELANLVLFLIDAKTPFLTGSNIKIDGGALV